MKRRSRTIALAGIARSTRRNDVTGDMLPAFADRYDVILRKTLEFLAAIGATVVKHDLDRLPFIARQRRLDSELGGAGTLVAHLAFQPNPIGISCIPSGPPGLNLFRVPLAKLALLGREVGEMAFTIESLRFRASRRLLAPLVSRAISVAIVLASRAFFGRDLGAMRLSPSGDVTGFAKTFGFKRAVGMTLSCIPQYESNIP